MEHRQDHLGAASRLLGGPAFRILVRGSAPDTPSAPQGATCTEFRLGNRGRAGRSGSEKRLKDDSVRLRVTPQERRLIEGKARQAVVTMSEFIRQAALNREVRSVADREAMADLGTCQRL
ncbi:plasmid mobilization protein [Azospirillum endophyticum]